MLGIAVFFFIAVIAFHYIEWLSFLEMKSVSRYILSYPNLTVFRFKAILVLSLISAFDQLFKSIQIIYVEIEEFPPALIGLPIAQAFDGNLSTSRLNVCVHDDLISPNPCGFTRWSRKYLIGTDSFMTMMCDV